MNATAVEAERDVVSGRWSVTLTSVGVTVTSFLFINGIAFLIPSMVSVLRISLVEAALLASMPSWGMVVTLILWGYLTDQLGERLVMTVGSALTAAAACCAAWFHSPFAMAGFLFVGGMAAASANTAGGSLVSGWFAQDRRGLAMGIRQTAQPLGIALGALLIPLVSDRGPSSGLMFLAAACTASTVASAVGIVDPPRIPSEAAGRPERASPYRGTYTLWRIHGVSALLMMPQTVTVTFMVIWLMRGRCFGHCGVGQRVGGDRDNRVRRSILERTRVRRAEHRPATDGSDRNTTLCDTVRGVSIPARVDPVRVISAVRHTVGASSGAPKSDQRAASVSLLAQRRSP
jgi:MFS family permease